MLCNSCKKEFDYFPGEKKVYQDRRIPLPEFCPICRQKRRLAFRNENNLYYGKSFLSNKKIISLYSHDSPFKVIDHEEWWGDDFDATIYGRDFDFSRPFFDQFNELQREVPRWNRIFINCENSEYTNNCENCKNSYMLFSSTDSEDCYYSTRLNKSNNCISCLRGMSSQYCSDCRSCHLCYDIHYSQVSLNCSNSYFLYDCQSCTDCIMCSGLRNKKYYILNKKYSKEDYEKYKEGFLRKIKVDINSFKAKFAELVKTAPIQSLLLVSVENCTGDYMGKSKNVVNGYNVVYNEDCINVYTCTKAKNCYDCFSLDHSELCLECDTSYELYDCLFCTYTVKLKNCRYCGQCVSLNNCFGCVGLKKKDYYILNKKYSKEEYFELLEKIEEHMKRTGEWGKPFPLSFSTFPYNKSMAQEDCPLTKEKAEDLNLMWEDEEEIVSPKEVYEMPEDPDETICDKVLVCEKSGKPYKIIPQEYRFYKKFNLPFPKLCPDERYKELFKTQNKTVLNPVKCKNCNLSIQTTYDSPEEYNIFCEKCFLETAY